MKNYKIRASNDNLSEVASLWDSFMNEAFSKDLGKVYGIYSNYESDETGKYDLEIVQEKSPNFSLPKGNFKEYTMEGDFPEAIYETWKIIWNDKINRKFEIDFEEYDFNNGSPKGKIFIGIN